MEELMLTRIEKKLLSRVMLFALATVGMFFILYFINQIELHSTAKVIVLIIFMVSIIFGLVQYEKNKLKIKYFS